jgi:hypothetical protein
MAPKTITIVGATGAQGKGVLSAFVADPAYHVRAVTRNPSSAGGKALADQGVEVVKADVNDVESLKRAFEGSHIIYAVTDFFAPFGTSGPAKAVEVEVAQGKNLATAAAATSTLEHYVWSTLPDGRALTGGKFVVPHFDGKNEVDRFIRANKELLTKTTFLWVTFYHSNLNFPVFTPTWVPSAGKYVQLANYAPDTPIYTIGDVTVNLGKFVRAAVEQPAKTQNGTIVLAKVETLPAEAFLQTWAKTKGVKAQFVEISGDAFRKLWPMLGEEMGIMMELWDAHHDHWVPLPGDKLISAKELGVTGLQSLEEGFKTYELPQ